MVLFLGNLTWNSKLKWTRAPTVLNLIEIFQVLDQTYFVLVCDFYVFDCHILIHDSGAVVLQSIPLSKPKPRQKSHWFSCFYLSRCQRFGIQSKSDLSLAAKQVTIINRPCNRYGVLGLKFIYSEKATKFSEISTVDLTVTTQDKSKVEI